MPPSIICPSAPILNNPALKPTAIPKEAKIKGVAAVNVSDIADIHITVAKSLIKLGENEIYNCGYGKGFSIMEAVDAMNSIIQFDLPIEFGSRRKSDIIHSVANNKKFLKRFNWEPKYNNLKIILESALEWEKKFK